MGWMFALGLFEVMVNIKILQGGKRPSDEISDSGDDPLERFLLCCCAAGKPHTDAFVNQEVPEHRGGSVQQIKGKKRLLNTSKHHPMHCIRGYSFKMYLRIQKWIFGLLHKVF